MAAARKASGRVTPSPLQIPTATPPPRSSGTRRTARSVTPTPTATPPTTPSPSTPHPGSPESYYINRLFEPSPASTPRRPSAKSSSTPRSSAKSSSTASPPVLSGYTPNKREKARPTVSVYSDGRTLNLVKGRKLLLADLDTPVSPSEATAVDGPARRGSGGSPRSPKSPTYSSGRDDPEGKLLRRDHNYRRIQFDLGHLDALE